MIERGVDFSAGIPSLATRTAWRDAANIKFAIVQYDAPQEMQAQMQAVVDGGFELEAYVYLYNGLSPWGQTPADRVRAALSYIDGFPCTRLWLDFEDDRPNAGPVQPQQVREAIGECDLVGMPTGIYTRRFYWRDMAGNTPEFSYLPLWDATYKASAPIPLWHLEPQDMSGFIPYGGWNRALIHQWHNTTNLDGIGVDLNVREAPVIVVPEPAPLPDFVSHDVEALANLLRELGNNGTKRVRWNNGVEFTDDRGRPLDPPVYLSV